MPRKLAFIIQSPQIESYNPVFLAICNSAGRLPTIGRIITTITAVYTIFENL